MWNDDSEKRGPRSSFPAGHAILRVSLNEIRVMAERTIWTGTSHLIVSFCLSLLQTSGETGKMSLLVESKTARSLVVLSFLVKANWRHTWCLNLGTHRHTLHVVVSKRMNIGSSDGGWGAVGSRVMSAGMRSTAGFRNRQRP